MNARATPFQPAVEILPLCIFLDTFPAPRAAPYFLLLSTFLHPLFLSNGAFFYGPFTSRKYILCMTFIFSWGEKLVHVQLLLHSQGGAHVSWVYNFLRAKRWELHLCQENPTGLSNGGSIQGAISVLLAQGKKGPFRPHCCRIVRYYYCRFIGTKEVEKERGRRRGRRH